MPNYTRPRGRRDPEPTDLAAAKRAAREAAAPKPAQVDDSYPAHWTEAGRAKLVKAHAPVPDDPNTQYPKNWKRG